MKAFVCNEVAHQDIARRARRARTLEIIGWLRARAEERRMTASIFNGRGAWALALETAAIALERSLEGHPHG